MAKRRRSPRLGWGLAASCVVHAVALGLVLAAPVKGPLRPTQPLAARPAMVWLRVERPAAAPVQVAAKTLAPAPRRAAAVHSPARAPVPALAPPAARRQQAEPVPMQAPSPAGSRITGIALAPASIPLSFGARFQAASHRPFVPAMPPPADLHASEAVRLALQQRIALLLAQLREQAAAADIAPGRCEMSYDAHSPVCDNDGLERTLDAARTLLSDVLQALRQTEPQTQGVALAYAEGEFRLQAQTPPAR